MVSNWKRRKASGTVIVRNRHIYYPDVKLHEEQIVLESAPLALVEESRQVDYPQRSKNSC